MPYHLTPLKCPFLKGGTKYERNNTSRTCDWNEYYHKNVINVCLISVQFILLYVLKHIKREIENKRPLVILSVDKT